MMDYKGLYIHVPFCIKKCKYCDFVSFTDEQEMYDKYISSVLKEASHYKGISVDTVFVGGGTPTVLSASQLKRLLQGVEEIFKITTDAEFSVEANPGTIDEEKLAVLKSCGVNRLSIGVQSFDDKELRMLGRIHDSKGALGAIQTAQRYFDNINIDIMTAIPGQTDQSLMNTLKTAVETGAQHLSCYSLILEEGTVLEAMVRSGEVKLLDDETDRKMYARMCSYLEAEGYERYEISNFSKPGRNCRHNLKYWNTQEYIGLGAAAHSYLDGKRFYNTSDLNCYINQPKKREESIELSQSDKVAEYIIMSLRTARGVDLKEFYNRFGFDFAENYASEICKFTQGGFLMLSDNRCYLTDKGIDVSNSIMCEFL